MIRKQPTSFKKRETYITPIEKLSKQIPGPGKYSANPEGKSTSKKKYTKKVDFNKLQK